ncbi:hypothetical protein BCR32DRAFT_251758 [Anaeromyces robustus]|uniref:Uncharacterized protein n=1 Tax=Anaeromyces robustus TaxID=1754192 RepID=A0A1Y1VKQ6_9FUNG|nr:hypothetical protein BCR32DRAFT_251758 [Anaeromyces robustus]|eukprot:ORX59051.1 hypothetical protein BCR32DRAFT_251758 [Anaeromyces robustus]
MRTIQEITNTIQRILNISINKSKDAINEINNIKDEDNQNNVANEEKEFENYSNTNTVNDNDNYKNNNNKYKHISNDNGEIESSKKTKQTLLERSEYISSKFKSKTHGNKPMIIQMKTEKI